MFSILGQSPIAMKSRFTSIKRSNRRFESDAISPASLPASGRAPQPER
jgi:hypothetical protein